jgi:hypothetical protein
MVLPARPTTWAFGGHSVDEAGKIFKILLLRAVESSATFWRAELPACAPSVRKAT